MSSQTHHFRIIGGKWRARQLAIADHIAVRPTPNRIRETLFNWLMNDIHGAICLDAFAGSGALGIEALSRGAEKVYFIEKEKSVLEQLEKNLGILKSEGAKLHLGSMPESLEKLSAPFDIVFLDPPFHQNLILPSLSALQKSNFLKKDALIYLEIEREFDLIKQLDLNWKILKNKQAGQVGYYLLKKCLNH